MTTELSEVEKKVIARQKAIDLSKRARKLQLEKSNNIDVSTLSIVKYEISYIFELGYKKNSDIPVQGFYLVNPDGPDLPAFKLTIVGEAFDLYMPVLNTDVDPNTIELPDLEQIKFKLENIKNKKDEDVVQRQYWIENLSNGKNK